MSDDGVIEFPLLSRNGVMKYKTWIAEAYRDIVRQALMTAEANPELGKYCFEFAFDTTNPDVNIPDWLMDDYPKTINIILNEQYENLSVMPDRFFVTVYIGGEPVHMIIPFSSILFFKDSMYGFETMINVSIPEEESTNKTAEETTDESKETNNVVSLDSFRNNNKGDE